MSGRKATSFTEVELEFLQLIWQHGEMTPEEVQSALREKGRDLTDGSIRKVLSILMKKGHLSREKKGRGHSYRAVVHKEQANRRMVRDLLDRAFSGSAYEMVATLLNTQEVGDKEIAEIKKLITKFEEQERK